MSRLFFWRLLCVFALGGGILQLIGFFLPYSLIIDTATHTVIEADSYWAPLPQFLSGNGASLFALALSIFVFAVILVPMVLACVELLKRPRSFPGVSQAGPAAGLIIALLGVLEVGGWTFISVAMPSFCVADDPRSCVLTGDFGAGFPFSLIGSLISSGCFLVLLILGLIWWHAVPAGKSLNRRGERWGSHTMRG